MIKRDKDTVSTKILIVDDSESARHFVIMVLQSQGYTVVGLDDPVRVAQAIGRTKPDCILMDVNMPGVKGDEVVRIIREFKLHPCLILFYSESDELELQQLVTQTGADGFVRKTNRPGALIVAIEQQLAKAWG